MEVALTNGEEVAEPDGIVSGVAGTGQKQGIQTGIIEKRDKENRHGTHKRVVIGLDVLYNGNMLPGPGNDVVLHPGTETGREDSAADLAFALFERDERIQDRLQKKIDRLDCRISKLENRRRIP